MAHDPAKGYDPAHLIPDAHIADLQGPHLEAARAFNEYIKAGLSKAEAGAKVRPILQGKGIGRAIRAVEGELPTQRKNDARGSKALPSDIRPLGGAKGGESSWRREANEQEVMKALELPVPNITEASYQHYQPAPSNFSELEAEHKELANKVNQKAASREEKIRKKTLDNTIYGDSERQAGTRLTINATNVDALKAKDPANREAARVRHLQLLERAQLTAGDVDTQVNLRTEQKGWGARIPGTTPDYIQCARHGCESEPFDSDLVDQEKNPRIIDSTLCPPCNEELRMGRLTGADAGFPAVHTPVTVKPGDPAYAIGAHSLLKAIFSPGAYTSPKDSARITSNLDRMFGEESSTPREKTIGPSGAVVEKKESKPLSTIRPISTEE
jgi:hypothetical protein